MSHDTHHKQEDSRPGTSFTGAIWFIIILAGVFVCAVNFVGVMSHDDGGHGTEHAAPAHEEAGHGHHEGEDHGHAH